MPAALKKALSRPLRIQYRRLTGTDKRGGVRLASQHTGYSHSIINKTLNPLKVKGLLKADLGFYRRVYRQNHELFISAGDAAIFPAAVFFTPLSTSKHITRGGNGCAST